jgi:hypothetical protein
MKYIYVQASMFFACELSFCNRKVNCVADSLSRVLESQQNVWVDDPPSFIIPLLIRPLLRIKSYRDSKARSAVCID